MVRHCAGGDVALIAPGELACLVETARPKLLPLQGNKSARMYSPNDGMKVCRVMKIGDLFKNVAGKSPLNSKI